MEEGLRKAITTVDHWTVSERAEVLLPRLRLFFPPHFQLIPTRRNERAKEEEEEEREGGDGTVSQLGGRTVVAAAKQRTAYHFGSAPSGVFLRLRLLLISADFCFPFFSFCLRTTDASSSATADVSNLP